MFGKLLKMTLSMLIFFIHLFSDFSRKNKSFSREIFGFSYFVGIAFFCKRDFFALETHNGITVEKVTFVSVGVWHVCH